MSGAEGEVMYDNFPLRSAFSISAIEPIYDTAPFG